MNYIQRRVSRTLIGVIVKFGVGVFKECFFEDRVRVRLGVKPNPIPNCTTAFFKKKKIDPGLGPANHYYAYS